MRVCILTYRQRPSSCSLAICECFKTFASKWSIKLTAKYSSCYLRSNVDFPDFVHGSIPFHTHLCANLSHDLSYISLYTSTIQWMQPVKSIIDQTITTANNNSFRDDTHSQGQHRSPFVWIKNAKTEKDFNAWYRWYDICNSIHTLHI